MNKPTLSRFCSLLVKLEILSYDQARFPIGGVRYKKYQNLITKIRNKLINAYGGE